MAKVYTIQIRKGGTGKTALSYNLVAMLARAGYKVLAIDLDGQGSLTIKYGVDKESKDILSIGQLMINALAGIDINYDQYIHHIDEHIDLIHGNNLSDALIKILATSDEPIYVLSDALKPIKDRYDYIIIDNAPALNQIVSNSFVASDQILMCVTPTGEAVDNIKDTLAMYNKIIKRSNPNLKINGILYNMVDERTKDCRYWEDKIVEIFPNIPVYETAIPKSVKVNEGNNVNKPIVDYMADNAVAIAYNEFFKEFMANPGISYKE